MTTKDLSLAELREVRSRCHAVGLGAGALGALDDAIAGAHAELLRGAASRMRVLYALGEAEELSFSIDITSDGDQLEIISCAGNPSNWCKPHGPCLVGMTTEVTTWHCFGTTHRSQNCTLTGMGSSPTRLFAVRVCICRFDRTEKKESKRRAFSLQLPHWGLSVWALGGAVLTKMCFGCLAARMFCSIPQRY